MILFVYLHKYIYYWGDKILDKYNKDNIVNLTEYKKKYVIKNIWKSCILFLMLILSTFHFLEGFIYNRWYNVFFYIFGTIYASLDISGLVFVRGLPIATIIHHSVVAILGTLNLLVDYNVSGYYRSIIIYTYFSIIPFLVNFYLGYRYVSTNIERIKKIAFYSYKIYLFSLLTNILCQVIFFVNQQYSNYLYIYIALYLLILNDDIKLIIFLKKESI